jgi:hypothetical protein
MIDDLGTLTGNYVPFRQGRKLDRNDLCAALFELEREVTSRGADVEHPFVAKIVRESERTDLVAKVVVSGRDKAVA